MGRSLKPLLTAGFVLVALTVLPLPANGGVDTANCDRLADLSQVHNACRDRGDCLSWPSVSCVTGRRSTGERFLANPTLALEWVILMALALMLFQARRLLEQARRKMEAADWTWLAFWTGAGAVLRCLGGTRIPGWVNSHGYELVRDVLVGQPSLAPDWHGHGFHALYGIATSVLPATEATLVFIQLLLSIASIPLVYAVARLWHHDRERAIGAAAVFAVLPTVVFYAGTEVHQVPGVFFLLLTLVFLGQAVRDPRPVTSLAAAVLGGLTCHFYPVFMMLPVVGLMWLFALPDGLRALRRPSSWVAIGVFLTLWAPWTGWLAAGFLAPDPGGGMLGGEFVRALSAPLEAVLPGFSVGPDTRSNVLLNYHFTPVPVMLLVVIGIASGFTRRERSRRRTIAVVLTTALLFTWLGTLTGRMNPARLQLVAQPFYAMLAGSGIAVALRWLRLGPNPGRLVTVVVLAASLVAFPGPVGERFTPQAEREVFEQGVATLEHGCVVIMPPHPRGGSNPVPYYLAEARGLAVSWGVVISKRVPPELAAATPCLLYYRPGTCYLDTGRGGDARSPLDPACEAVEAQLSLGEAVVRDVEARSDCVENYTTDPLRIGFFRVNHIHTGAPREKGESGP